MLPSTTAYINTENMMLATWVMERDNYYLDIFDAMLRDASEIFIRRCSCTDLLKMCLKQKRDITELFTDTIVFFDENNSRYDTMG